MKISVCKGQLLNRCPKCKYDVDPQHHPNNLDCPYYQGIGCVYIDLIDENKEVASVRSKPTSQKMS